MPESERSCAIDCRPAMESVHITAGTNQTSLVSDPKIEQRALPFMRAHPITHSNSACTYCSFARDWLYLLVRAPSASYLVNRLLALALSRLFTCTMPLDS